MIYVERISEDGLSKVRFGFQPKTNALQYEEYFTFYRDTVEEPWGDDWPDALSYEKWCAARGLEPCHCNCEDEYCCLYEQYEAYKKELNPCAHHAANGKPKMSGSWSGRISNLPPCPDQVAAEALTKFIKSFTVQWKVIY